VLWRVAIVPTSPYVERALWVEADDLVHVGPYLVAVADVPVIGLPRPVVVLRLRLVDVAAVHAVTG
jgi:hypothetical protein